MGMHVWNDETIAELTRLWEEGFSASLIGERMGITRNMVCGKVNRLDLLCPPMHKKIMREGPPKPEKAPKPAKVKRAAPRPRQTYETVRLVRATHSSKSMKLLYSLATDPVALRCVEVNPLHLSIYDLTATTCRHPYGDTAPFSFCGHRTLEGHSYCPDHKALNTEPTRHPLNVNRLAKVA
jgi:GcrA cell cycle regulator